MVNGEPISADMVLRELVRIHNQRGHDTSRVAFSVDKLVQKLVNDRLLAQEARAIGLDQDSNLVTHLERHRGQVALASLLAQALPDTFTVGAEELQTAYARNFQRFELRLVAVNDSLLAEAIADSARRGTPLERLAKTHSIDRYKDAGGFMGAVALAAQPPALQSRLVKSRVGDVIGPLPLWRVFCVYHVDGILPADSTVPLDSVRADLESQLIARKQREAREAYSKQLRTEWPVVIDSARVDSVLEHMAAGVAPAASNVTTIGETRVITETDLRNKYIHKTVGRVDRENFALLYAVLNESIETALLELAAARSDAAHMPATEAAVRAYEDSLLVVAYLEDVVSETVKITPEEIAAHYEANKDRYREATRYKIATLTRATESEAAEDFRALTNGADFAWLARRNSTDEARGKGGERDWIPADKVPGDAAPALDTLTVGAVTAPRFTESGYMLIKLVGREQGAVVPPARVEAHIRAHLQRVKEMDAIGETIRLLRESAHIELNEKTIQELQITGRKG